MITPDIFDLLHPPCGDCALLDPKPIDSGIRYCHGAKVWRWASDRVDCGYRQPNPARAA